MSTGDPQTVTPAVLRDAADRAKQLKTELQTIRIQAHGTEGDQEVAHENGYTYEGRSVRSTRDLSATGAEGHLSQTLHAMRQSTFNTTPSMTPGANFAPTPQRHSQILQEDVHKGLKQLDKYLHDLFLASEKLREKTLSAGRGSHESVNYRKIGLSRATLQSRASPSTERHHHSTQDETYSSPERSREMLGQCRGNNLSPKHDIPNMTEADYRNWTIQTPAWAPPDSSSKFRDYRSSKRQTKKPVPPALSPSFAVKPLSPAEEQHLKESVLSRSREASAVKDRMDRINRKKTSPAKTRKINFPGHPMKAIDQRRETLIKMRDERKAESPAYYRRISVSPPKSKSPPPPSKRPPREQSYVYSPVSSMTSQPANKASFGSPVKSEDGNVAQYSLKIDDLPLKEKSPPSSKPVVTASKPSSSKPSSSKASSSKPSSSKPSTPKPSSPKPSSSKSAAAAKARKPILKQALVGEVDPQKHERPTSSMALNSGQSETTGWANFADESPPRVEMGGGESASLPPPQLNMAVSPPVELSPAEKVPSVPEVNSKTFTLRKSGGQIGVARAEKNEESVVADKANDDDKDSEDSGGTFDFLDETDEVAQNANATTEEDDIELTSSDDSEVEDGSAADRSKQEAPAPRKSLSSPALRTAVRRMSDLLNSKDIPEEADGQSKPSTPETTPTKTKGKGLFGRLRTLGKSKSPSPNCVGDKSSERKAKKFGRGGSPESKSKGSAFDARLRQTIILAMPISSRVCAREIVERFKAGVGLRISLTPRLVPDLNGNNMWLVALDASGTAPVLRCSHPTRSMIGPFRVENAHVSISGCESPNNVFMTLMLRDLKGNSIEAKLISDQLDWAAFCILGVNIAFHVTDKLREQRIHSKLRKTALTYKWHESIIISETLD